MVYGSFRCGTPLIFLEDLPVWTQPTPNEIESYVALLRFQRCLPIDSRGEETGLQIFVLLLLTGTRKNERKREEIYEIGVESEPFSLSFRFLFDGRKCQNAFQEPAHFSIFASVRCFVRAFFRRCFQRAPFCL